MANNISLETPEDRNRYASKIKQDFERNSLDYWWVSPSVRTNEILIAPKNQSEWQKEAYAPISRISVQLNPDGRPNFGVSGYNPYRIEYEKPEFESKGYQYHRHVDKRGRQGRWWLIKTLNNIDDISREFKDIEHLIRKKN